MARAAKKPVKQGWGEGAITQRGTSWRIRYREDGARKSASFESRQEALDELEKIQARQKLGQPGREERPATIKPSASSTIADLVSKWVEDRRRFDVRTADEDVARWALHLAQPLETQTLAGLTPKWVRELAGDLVKPEVGSKAPDGTKKRPVSGPTAHRVLTLLSSFLRWCRREGHVTTNVAAEALTDPDVKRLLAPKSDEQEDGKPLESWDQVEQLYAALGLTSVGICYLLQARCGLRPGEARALRWTDVDLKAGKVTVRRQVRHGKEGPTKGNRAREVPCPALVDRLKAWRKVNPSELVCPPGCRVDADGNPSTPYAGFLGDKAIEAAMSKAFKATGIEPRTAYEAGRITFCTILGADPRVAPVQLQRWAGHRNIETTLRYIKRTSADLAALA